ncbi:MAG: PorP/SprF family type IX secretion system membrane protein [Bacteroidota bacterium]
MKRFIYTFLLFAGILFHTSVNGQDPHFSQFHSAPLTLNPAMTGLMNHDMRLVANYRNQWATVTTPYQTMSASVDFSILNGISEFDFFGVGLLVMNDKAGDANFKTTQFQLSFAYSKTLSGGADHYFSIGGQFGGVQRSVDFASLTFDSQFDGDVINSGLGSGETIANDQKFYLDFSAGIAWYYMPNSYSSIYAGAAISHLNEPDISFYETDVRENLYKKYTFHLGGEIGFGGDFSFIPRGIILVQGPHREYNFGGMVKYLVTEEDPIYQAVYLGTTHRLGDAQSVVVRYDFGPFGVGFSYDFNISKLTRASRSLAGPEIALTYRTNFWQEDKRGSRGRILCPDM